MRKLKEIKDEIQGCIDKLSLLAKELHVTEYIAAGEDDRPVNVVIGRRLAASLFQYISGKESITTDEAFEVAACLSQAITNPLIHPAEEI